MVLIKCPMGGIEVGWKFFRNNLEIVCYPMCYRLHENRDMMGLGYENRIWKYPWDMKIWEYEHMRIWKYGYENRDMMGLGYENRIWIYPWHMTIKLLNVHVSNHTRMSNVTYKRESHVQTSHDAYVHESCHMTLHTHSLIHSNLKHFVLKGVGHFWFCLFCAYGLVGSNMNVSCHIWMSHVMCECILSYLYESCHVWMNHVTDEKEKAYEQVMSTFHVPVCAYK